MKPIFRICPSCNNEFQALRKNKTYCSDTCRAEVNNEKLRDKMKSIKDLEDKSGLVDKLKTAYFSAIRVVIINYNVEKDGDSVLFEGKRFKSHSFTDELLDNLGIKLKGADFEAGSFERVAIYFPSEKSLCFKKDPYSSYTHTFKMV